MSSPATIESVLEGLCTLVEAPPSHVNVAIIHHDVSCQDPIEGNMVCFTTLRCWKTIADTIEAYQNRFSTKATVSMTKIASGNIVHNQAKLMKLHRVNAKGLIILKASIVPVVNPIHKYELFVELGDLWKIHATTLFVEMFQHSDVDQMHHNIVATWGSLSNLEVSKLHRFSELLRNLMHDDHEFRAFIIFYHGLRPVTGDSMPHGYVCDAEVDVRSAFGQWRNQDSAKMKTFKEQARLQIRDYSLPRLPDNALAAQYAGNQLGFFRGTNDKDFDHTLAIDVSSISLEVLESAAEAHTALLNSIYDRLLSHSTLDHKMWLTEIDLLRQDMGKTPFKIGIVGATGAGKSSIINAFLHEAHLLPTSSWRACTAVVTAISYNYATIDSYRAIVQFVSHDDWKQELLALISDVSDTDDATTRQARQTSKEAEVAWDKIAAVYPDMSKAQIAKSTIENLLQHDNLENLLGSSLEVTATTAEELSGKLDRFIDSRDRHGSKLTGISKEPALWPIVQCVELFTKSAVLKDGMQLVDLPGIHDCNKARSAVAEKHISTCSSLWIIAPITRAVDDRSARELLGQAFKRQLKLDGTHGSATFVGSKTDEIGPVNEVARQLRIELQIQHIQQEHTRTDHQLFILRKQRDDKLEVQNSTRNDLGLIKAEMHVYRVLSKSKQLLQNGFVSEPRKGGRKRKRSTSHRAIAARKKRNTTPTLSDDDASQDSETEPAGSQRQLVMADVEENIATLNDRFATISAQRTARKLEIEAIEAQVKSATATLKDLTAEKWRKCVAARNERTRQTIKNDFGAGIREYDYELAAKSPGTDHDADLRDYDEIGEQLPVFCVSSRAYQRLAGLSDNDNVNEYFSSLEQTEMPALQRHATQLTKDNRKEYLARYINRAALLMTSMTLWVTSDHPGKSSKHDEVVAHNERIRRGLAKLRKDLENFAVLCIDSISRDIEINILNVIPRARSVAYKEILIAPLGHGLHFRTYQAICKRDGVFRNQAGLHNFNETLAEPMLESIAMGWARAFQTLIPDAAHSGMDSSSTCLEEFHASISEGVQQYGLNNGTMDLLCRQLPRYKHELVTFYDILMSNLVAAQKQTNRSLVPSVQKHLEASYVSAAQQQGSGMYAAMKEIINDETHAADQAIFRAASTPVSQRLTDMVAHGKASLLSSILSTVNKLEKDYMSLITDVPAKQSKEESRLKLDICRILAQPSQANNITSQDLDSIKREPACTLESEVRIKRELTAQDFPTIDNDKMIIMTLE